MERLVNDQEEETETEGEGENGDIVTLNKDIDDESNRTNLTIPPELAKSYTFGCNRFHPKFLQKLANKKFFTAILSVFAFFQSAIVSGLTSVSLTAIEKRYRLTSTAVGVIPICYDIAVTLSIVFISYFGGKSHKPRWLGFSMITLALGTFLFSSPEFLLGQYKAGSSNRYLYEACLDKRNFTSDCSSSDNFALTLFVFGKFLMGIGAAPLYTVAQAYLDEIVFPKYITIHMGIYHSMGILGPAFGYGIGSAGLSIYVDPWVHTTLTTDDPAWVGAWWMSFVLVGVLTLVGSIPFLMFPRYLPDSYLVRRERLKEMAKTYSSDYTNESSFVVKLKMFPVHIKRLLFNPSYMFISLALGGMYLLTSGLVAFGPQYLETQFHLTATVAGLIAGGVGITTAVFGVMGGAIIIYVFKLKGSRVALLGLIISVCVIPFSLGVLIHCPSTQVAGINVPYPNSTEIEFDVSPCISDCHCTSHIYEPVCGSDNLTYFSPCRAGCANTQTSNGNYVFSNCSCVAKGLISANGSLANISLNEVIYQYSFATNSKCQSHCNFLIPFVIGLMLIMLLVFSVQIPVYYFSMRVVADDQRSLALGLQSAIWRIFGAIPGPLIFGAIFDGTCLNWEGECGRRGNCWVYDNSLLSIHTLSMTIPVMLIVCVLFLLSCLTYPKKQVTYDVVSQEREDQIGMTSGSQWQARFRKNIKEEVEISMQ